MINSSSVTIPPVLILSTGRCGSTMVSNILNRHPRVLSLSEFFSYFGSVPFRFRHPTSNWMWKSYSRQRIHTRHMVQGRHEELLYPIDDPNARFTPDTVPPILCATLPHLTVRYEELFDTLEPIVRGQPRQPVADHLRHLFQWLCQRFDCCTWAERSGTSLLFASRLLRLFPDARLVHVYRDGRETALSMSHHYLFRVIAATIKVCSGLGIDIIASLRRDAYHRTSPWMEPFVSMCFNPKWLPYDKVTLADFGTLWSQMIEIADQTFAHFPSDRLLSLKFEDMQADPDTELRRFIRFIDPKLEDETWLHEACSIPRPTTSKFAQLAPAEQAALTEACRPGLERLGYSL